MSARPFLPAPAPEWLARIFGARGWLSGADADLRLRILQEARAVRIDAGDLLFAAGDPPGGVFGVVSGSIGMEGSSAVAEPVLCHVVQPGGWLGEGPAIAGHGRTTSFVALEPSVLVHLSLAAMERIADGEPRFRPLVARQAEMSAQLGIRTVSELLIPDGSRRVMATLLRVTAADEEDPASFPRTYRLGQGQLAELSGYSRHQVNRVLGALRDCGVLQLGYGSITIVDLAALLAAARERTDAPARISAGRGG